MEIKAELKLYLKQKQWPYRSADEDNLAIQTCPFCDRSKWKFYIHATRLVYRCWHCEAKGNFYKLRRALGDLTKVVAASDLGDNSNTKTSKAKTTVPPKKIAQWHKQLLADKDAIEYCKARGFTIETIKRFRLGLEIKNNKRWLVIPHVHTKVCHNAKFRVLPPAEKSFRRVKGGASVLFNQDCLAMYDRIVIAESETDAIALWQAGIKNVVALTCGADTFLPEWYDLLADKEEIMLVLDADSVGQQGARSIARRLGFDKCFNVLLPAHDANEVLTAGGPEKLREAVQNKEQFEVSGIVSIADALGRARNDAEAGTIGLLTPWKDVNSLLGSGWHAGDLVVLTARVKIGKTTLALNEALWLAEQNQPTLFYCLEMGVDRLTKKVASYYRRKTDDELDAVDYAMTRYQLRQMPFYFVEPDWSGSLKIEYVFGKIREAVKRYGIRLLVFDHLHFLCRSLQYVTTEIGQVTRAFKLLAEELGIVVLLVAHPKKIGSDRVLRYEDIKDSSSIPADADQIIILHRKSLTAGLDDKDASSVKDNEVLAPETLLRVDAARFRSGGDCMLYYDGATARFLDIQDRPK